MSSTQNGVCPVTLDANEMVQMVPDNLIFGFEGVDSKDGKNVENDWNSSDDFLGAYDPVVPREDYEAKRGDKVQEMYVENKERTAVVLNRSPAKKGGNSRRKRKMAERGDDGGAGSSLVYVPRKEKTDMSVQDVEMMVDALDQKKIDAPGAYTKEDEKERKRLKSLHARMKGHMQRTTDARMVEVLSAHLHQKDALIASFMEATTRAHALLDKLNVRSQDDAQEQESDRVVQLIEELHQRVAATQQHQAAAP